MPTTTNPKATAVANADAAARTRTINPAHLTGNYVRQAVGTLEVTAADTTGSIYRFARLRSSDRISSIAEVHDAVAASASAKIGLYRTAADGGAPAVTNAEQLFHTGLSLVSASTTKAGVTFGALDIANAEKRLWELLGLTADPGVDYDLCYTVAYTGAPNAATLSLWVEYVSGN